MIFRSDINGLRAIAVLAVVLFHFGVVGVQGGFVGVDVFFVISGYLMTRIIFQGIERQQFSLLGFYLDRGRRIIPALALLCLAVLVMGWFLLLPADYMTLARHAISSITFSSNVRFFMKQGILIPRHVVIGYCIHGRCPLNGNFICCIPLLF